MDRLALARLIDHTLLRPEASEQAMEALCREAVEHRFAAVCVNPAWVALAARLLARSEVVVCSVVGFPLGATTTAVKVFETRRAIASGAREIDVVINLGELKSSRPEAVGRDIAAVASACREGRTLCKAIIETGLLTDEEKAKASTLAKAAGAAFVKTSTGYGPGGATAADVALIRGAVGPEMGIKASGGIRDLESVQRMVAAGATRIGTSAAVAIMREARGEGRTDRAEG